MCAFAGVALTRKCSSLGLLFFPPFWHHHPAGLGSRAPLVLGICISPEGLGRLVVNRPIVIRWPQLSVYQWHCPWFLFSPCFLGWESFVVYRGTHLLILCTFTMDPDVIFMSGVHHVLLITSFTVKYNVPFRQQSNSHKYTKTTTTVWEVGIWCSIKRPNIGLLKPTLQDGTVSSILVDDNCGNVLSLCPPVSCDYDNT